MSIASDAFGFPLRGKGVGLLVTGTVLGVISELVGLAPLVGFFAYVFLAGYMAGIYFQIIQTTASGSPEAPEYPEISNIMEDLVFPFLQVLFVGLVSFAPATIYFYTGGGGFPGFLLILLGCAYFPMAMLAVVVLGEIWVIRPTLVIPSIFKVGWFYGLILVMLVVLYTLEMVFRDWFGGTLIVGSLVTALVAMYTLMVNGRLLGLLYLEKQEELEWL